MISVVIPVFNGADYLGGAIESVLSQTLPPAEVIVVDDGSYDSTAAVVRSFTARVHYYWQPNQGAGTARNHGIGAAKGDFLAFLDADDLWLPDKLRLQRAAFDSDASLDLVFCHMSQFRVPEGSLGGTGDAHLEETAQPSPLISCLLARRAAFDRVGPLATNLKADFVDWYLRAKEAGLHINILDSLLVRRRLHGDNFTLRNKDVRQEYLKLLKASLDRRRAGQSKG